MKKYINKLVDFYKDEEGASGIEYAIVAAMVAVVIISFSTNVRTGISGIFTSIVSGLSSGSGGA